MTTADFKTLQSNAVAGPVGPTGDTGAVGPTGPTGDAFTWRSAWLVATGYLGKDIVSHNGASYTCILGHTSGAASEPGIGGSWATYWDLMSDKGDTGPTGPTGPVGGAAHTVISDGIHTDTKVTGSEANGDFLLFGAANKWTNHPFKPLIANFSQYILHGSTANYYYGSMKSGWGGGLWDANAATPAVAYATCGIIVPFDLISLNIYMQLQSDIAAQTIYVQLWQSSRPNGGPTLPSLAVIGGATSVVLTAANRTYNLDLTPTVTLTKGTLLFIGIRNSSTGGAYTYNDILVIGTPKVA